MMKAERLSTPISYGDAGGGRGDGDDEGDDRDGGRGDQANGC